MKNLRDFRIEAGLTLEVMAEKLGCSLNAISRWETGKSQPVPSMIPKLAALFSLTPAEARESLAESRRQAAAARETAAANR